MEYSNIENDFVSRTLTLLHGYDGEYEITLLINCCLGLLVLPKERHYNTIPKRAIPESGELWGMSRKSLTVHCEECGYELAEVLRRLRNGICHFKLKTLPNNSGDIANVEIRDGKRFKAILSTDQLRDLAVSFGEHVIRNNKDSRKTSRVTR